jgi:hypothetical protein
MKRKTPKKTPTAPGRRRRASLHLLLGDGLLRQQIPKGIPLRGLALRSALDAMILR